MSEGVLLGVAIGVGLWLVVARLAVLGAPGLAQRVALHLQRPTAEASLGGTVSATVEGLARPYVDGAATWLGQVLGGAETVERRLRRAGAELDLQAFRVSQVLWGTAFFAGAVVLSLLLVAAGSARSPGLLIVFAGATAVAGVVARDQMLSRQIRAREERILAELPTVADLLAVSVAAGESPAAALDRTARVSRGELGRELSLALADVRAGDGLLSALDHMAARLDVAPVTRFVDGICVAVERGTPLADVLRAQATDARDVRTRALMEIGGRKEILMLVPVVFLVLPVTVLFALFPGLVHFDVIAP